MKVGFAARWSPLDKRSWSGIPYYTYQEINKYFETEIFHFKWNWRLRESLTMQKSLNKKLFGKNSAVEFLPTYAKYFSRQLQNELKHRPVDLLFLTASPQLIAYLETDIPIVFMTDATFQQLQGYYPTFKNIADYNIRKGIEVDKRAFQNFSHALLASEWNKNSAVEDYGIDASKITVAPFGANLDDIPVPSLTTKYSEEIKLLFLGVEWERKGGDIVLETFNLLAEKNIPARLHIIGCVPPHDVSGNERITVIPFLDKNKKQDKDQLDKIFELTDLLFLPTRSECAGVVFSESSAYGIPSLTTDTGGVTTYVKNNINGFALPVTAGPPEYAQKISELFNDRNLLVELGKSSRKYYEEKLNWEVWGKKFKSVAEELTSPKK